MAGNAVPQSQLDALPILTVAQAAQGGDVQVIGGQLVKTFNPDQLGINGIVGLSQITPLGAPDQIIYLATPYLDLTGCTKYSVLLRCTNTSAGNLLPPPVTMYLQARMGPLDVPPLFYFDTTNADNPIHNAQDSVCAAGRAWATIVAGGSNTLRFDFGFAGVAYTDAILAMPMMLGANSRIVTKCPHAGVAPDPNLKYTMFVMGHS